MARNGLSEKFIAAFRSAESGHREAIKECYTVRPLRTKTMLGEGGVLQDTCRHLAKTLELALEYKREWYTIDALFVSGKELIYPDGSVASDGHRLWYPSRLDVLVEHENDEKLEEEMWKLLFWHAKLKVIIGYDFCDNEYDEKLGRGQSGAKRDWAPGKIQQLRGMLREVHGADGDGAEYLLVLGNRGAWADDSPVAWRWCRLDDDSSELVPLG